jgi:hypothetical protein
MVEPCLVAGLQLSGRVTDVPLLASKPHTLAYRPCFAFRSWRCETVKVSAYRSRSTGLRTVCSKFWPPPLPVSAIKMWGSISRGVTDSWATAHPADQFVTGNAMPLTEFLGMTDFNRIG